MPISISTGRKMQMFLLDLLYPNRCPCCNCSISWREYLCEACRQEVTAEPADAFCPLCGKLPRDCFCGTGLSYDRAAILTEYTGAARAGVLSMKSAASLHFGRFCGNVLGQRIAKMRCCPAMTWLFLYPCSCGNSGNVAVILPQYLPGRSPLSRGFPTGRTYCTTTVPARRSTPFPPPNAIKMWNSFLPLRYRWKACGFCCAMMYSPPAAP